MQGNGYTIGPLIGRILISLIFILGALSKIFSFESSLFTLKQLGIQQQTHYYLIFAILTELIGGLLVLLGWKTSIGCWILFIFLVPVTFLAHGFWNFPAEEAANQSAHFFKNIAIFGGLVLLITYGPGRWSLDALSKKSE